jgi:alanyl aminopeptidase
MIAPLTWIEAAALSLALQAAIAAAPAPPTFRLPDVAQPDQESLDITIVPGEPEFSGSATLRITLKTTVSVLWMNAKDLLIRDVSVNSDGTAKKIRKVVNGEFLGLEFEAAAGPGPIEIGIRYSGRLSDETNSGLFRKKAGRDWYAYTMFTPIEARRAFPCFDEPGYKTNWRLTLHIPRADIAVANSPITSETDEPEGMKKVVFAETPPLPSEVVAFAAGPFEVVEAGVAGTKRIPVRVITPHGRSGEAAAARAATPDILQKLETYTGIPYPWAKLDHLAVLDLPYGAVENPGLIAYRDRLLLAAPERDTEYRQRAMRMTMAHELAHQWFGNLVTQAWWNDVWLSEGFATWLGGNVSDLELPAFERGLAAASRRNSMLIQDAAERVRPVRLAMNSRDDMKQVYSGVVYEKGSAILSMLEEWIGPERFRAALRRYLVAHANGNATTSDVAVAIREATGVDASAVLKSFLDRPHAPEFRVSAHCEGSAGSLVVEQSGQPWTTPVCWHAEDGGRACTVVDSQRLVKPLGACGGWVWPNGTGVGYYRSAPDTLLLSAVITKGYQELSGPERLSLVGDLAAATLNGSERAGDILRLLPALVRDSEPAVAMHAEAILLELALAVPNPSRGAYREWLRQNLGILPPGPAQASNLEEYLNERKTHQPDGH